MKFGVPCVDWLKMGKALSRLFGKKDMRILMLGLDAAGKTSILNLNIEANVSSLHAEVCKVVEGEKV